MKALRERTDAVRRLVKELGWDADVSEADAKGVVSITSDGTIDVRFNDLTRLSQAAETKAINLHYDGGWCGTEMTPGDPSIFGIHIRMTLLEQLRYLLVETSPSNEADVFHRLLTAACSELGLTGRDFSGPLPVDVTTADRWIRGESTPRPLMRPYVYHFLADRVRNAR